MAFLLFAYSVIARLFHLSFDLSHAKQAKGEIENNSCGTTEGFYSVNTEKRTSQMLLNLLQNGGCSGKKYVLDLVLFQRALTLFCPTAAVPFNRRRDSSS